MRDTQRQYISAGIILSLSDILLFQILLETVQHSAFGTCPKRSNEQIFWSVPGKPVYDDIRAEPCNAFPKHPDIFLHVRSVEGGAGILFCQIGVLQDMEELQFDPLYVTAVQIV